MLHAGGWGVSYCDKFMFTNTRCDNSEISVLIIDRINTF